MGAILGKAGSIVAQIRAETGAGIRIHPVPMRLPKGMGENDEIIQIDGNKGSCVAAVRRVATLLRGWMVSNPAHWLPTALSTLLHTSGVTEGITEVLAVMRACASFSPGWRASTEDLPDSAL